MSETLQPGVPSFNIDGVYRFFHCSLTDLIHALQEQCGCRLLGHGMQPTDLIATKQTFRVVEYQQCGWSVVCPIDEGTWQLDSNLSEEHLQNIADKLGCDFVFLGLYDTAGGVEYKHFRAGNLLEHVRYDGETEEETFSSSLRERSEALGLPYGFIDSVVAELGIVVPSFYSPFERVGRPIKVLEEIDACSDSITDCYVLEAMPSIG